MSVGVADNSYYKKSSGQIGVSVVSMMKPRKNRGVFAICAFALIIGSSLGCWTKDLGIACGNK